MRGFGSGHGAAGTDFSLALPAAPDSGTRKNYNLIDLSPVYVAAVVLQDHSRTFPRLSRIAFDMLSIPAMPAECEREEFASVRPSRFEVLNGTNGLIRDYKRNRRAFERVKRNQRRL